MVREREREKELDEICLYACMTYLLIHKDSIIENRVSLRHIIEGSLFTKN